MLIYLLSIKRLPHYIQFSKRKIKESDLLLGSPKFVQALRQAQNLSSVALCCCSFHPSNINESIENPNMNQAPPFDFSHQNDKKG